VRRPPGKDLQQENACLGAEHGFGRGDGWRRTDRRRLVVLVIVGHCRRGGGDGSGGGGGGRRRRRWSTLFENPLTLGQTFHAGQTVRGRRTRRVRLGQRRWRRRLGYSAVVEAVADAFAVNHINSIAPREAATTKATRNEFFSIENNTVGPATTDESETQVVRDTRHTVLEMRHPQRGE